MERLQKVMAHAGVASRRKCESFILEGRVTVNGDVITELGTQVDPAKDQIMVDGRAINKEQKRIFLFYKPINVMTTMSDPEGRRTVAHFVEDIPERVYPVGRLDFDTEGLLLLTNDGELANRLMHPRYEIEKTYLATVRGQVEEKELERLRKGIRLEDGWTQPAQVERQKMSNHQTVLKLVIHEGRNRQIRRMCEAVGHPVQQLVRTQVAFLRLNGLKRGDIRELKKHEIEKLDMLLRG
ncbi:pseudouridine synthase [Mechercharimyces sp. CAU 1602]|uniref:pseudouridine synthase n=1 Tax=Mechercharimyces sp. CAU 1602 TaxID=2973933 RepID=UPI002161C810|nr:pseudouridine synthase [Mechercharimyces sp. CAU 1602]MCS1350928.1 rRNA pseudouridine synthase [Mechercharimyces sp. CAU 1602]